MKKTKQKIDEWDGTIIIRWCDIILLLILITLWIKL